MKKTKHFNISVPELGDVPDITQVSNAISDLEDATAGTLEIMKAEMQGTKITLTSVSRKTKRTGYYEGMSIRFKSPQDIEPNYLKTISVDGLGDQTLSVEYKVNRNEYIDIVYEGNKFTAYPVVVQKTDSVSENSSVLVGTAKGVKTAYDKGVEALNKANQAQSSANQAQSTADGKFDKTGGDITGNVSIKKNGVKEINFYDAGNMHYMQLSSSGNDNGLMFINKKTNYGIYLDGNGHTRIDAPNLVTVNKEIVAAINELNSGKEDKIEKKSGFNLEKSDSVTSNSSSTLATSAAVKTAYDKGVNAERIANTKEPAFIKKSGFNLEKTSDYKSADTNKVFTQQGANSLYKKLEVDDYYIAFNLNQIKRNFKSLSATHIINDESPKLLLELLLERDADDLAQSTNLKTNSKEVVGAINELHEGGKYLDDKKANIDSPALTGTPKAPTPATGDNSTKIATTAFVANTAIGVGQNWQDFSSSRSPGVTYTNKTGRPIMISIAWDKAASGPGSFGFFIDQIEIVPSVTTHDGFASCCQFIIPNLSTYKVALFGNVFIRKWAELR